MMSITESGTGVDVAGEANVVSVVERALFNAALEFYGAAAGVIDVDGGERPRMRWDVEGLQGVRAAMGALERRIDVARRAGFSAERIAGVARLDRDVVDLILARQRGAVRPSH